MAQQTYGEWMRSNPPILTLTAVEWLANELANTGLLVTKDVDNLVAYHKAKQMEKEQIIEAATRWKGTDFAEQYYNETYGNKS